MVSNLYTKHRQKVYEKPRLIIKKSKQIGGLSKTSQQVGIIVLIKHNVGCHIGSWLR